MGSTVDVPMRYRWWKAVEAIAPGAVASLGALLALAGLVLAVTGNLTRSTWLTAIGCVYLAWLPWTIVRVIVSYRRGQVPTGCNAPGRGR